MRSPAGCPVGARQEAVRSEPAGRSRADQLAPTVEQVAEKYQGKAKVLKMNVDDNLENPAKYGIRGIPTLILFNKGEEVERRVGIPGNASVELAQMIERQL